MRLLSGGQRPLPAETSTDAKLMTWFGPSTTEQQYGRSEQANKTRSSKEKGKIDLDFFQSSDPLLHGITGHIPSVLVDCLC